MRLTSRFHVLLFLMLGATAVYAEPLVGRVVSIADGDTITVLDANRQQHKIRLMGIDAPEKAQPFGQKSKSSLSAMVFNRDVEIVGDKKDRYGRTIGKVMLIPGMNAGACAMTRLHGTDVPSAVVPTCLLQALADPGMNAGACGSRGTFPAEGSVERFFEAHGQVMAADPNCNVAACPKIHDVNLMQVMSGMAWWYRQYAKEQTPKDREDYEVAEFNAKVRRQGLWADKNPVAPWEWRRHRR